MERISWPGGRVEGLVDRALRLLDQPGRAVLGIAGAPAAGKSTLAALLVAELERLRPGEVVAVGMDAFHLGHRVLVRRGQTEIKGAPETFDALGFVALLQRALDETGVTVYAPEFDRDLEDSIAHVVEIGPQVGLVITEGNYLLLDASPWDGVRTVLDETWFVHLADDERRRRIVARHRRHGHSPEDAEQRAFGSDERNARLVNGTSAVPDLWIEQVYPSLTGTSLGVEPPRLNTL